MKTRSLNVLFALLCPLLAHAQLNVTPMSQAPVFQGVNRIGNLRDVFNVKFSGADAAIAYFFGKTSIGLE